MILANLTGVFIMVLGVAVGWTFFQFVGPRVLPESADLATINAFLCALVVSLTALIFDRYPERQFVRGYAANLRAFWARRYPRTASRLQLARDPSYRLAAFIVPLAFAPFVVVAGYAVIALAMVAGGFPLPPGEHLSRFAIIAGTTLTAWFVVAAFLHRSRRTAGFSA
jgi:hypothetical protein